MSHIVTAPRLGRYTTTAIVLHWLIAALLVVNVVLGLSADAFPEAWVRPVIDLHKSVGLTALGLVLLRLLWRASHPAPKLPGSYSRREQVAAHCAHAGLYGLILLLPLSGWLHDSAFKAAAAHPLKLFWIIPWFRIGAVADIDPVAKEVWHTRFYLLHMWSAYGLYALTALHVLAALKHQFIDGAAELQRMGVGRMR